MEDSDRGHLKKIRNSSTFVRAFKDFDQETTMKILCQLRLPKAIRKKLGLMEREMEVNFC